MKQKPIVFFDEATSVHDDFLDSLGSLIVASKYDAITIDSMSQVDEALKTTATGRIVKSRPEFAMPYGGKSSGKSKLSELMWGCWDKAFSPTNTVRRDLKQLATAQSTPLKGVDPLFEAMEKHNECVRMGKKALAEMFHAQPIPGIYPTKGPIKAKDWE